MISRFKRAELGLLLVLLLACVGRAWADPPTRVGRLNYLSGEVSFSPAGVDQWANATLNYPLTTGDRLCKYPAAHPARPALREMAPPVHQPEIRQTKPLQLADKKPPAKQPIPGGDNRKHVPEQPSK